MQGGKLMNTTQNGNYGKLIAFFLIAISLLSVLVVSANGWQTDEPIYPSGNTTTDNQGNDDEAPNTQYPNEEIESRKFYHHITGLETSEELYGVPQVAYVIDSNSPLCGIYNCNILIEFPIENDKSRFLMINDITDEISKIGSITYSRYYISNLAKVFGAPTVSLENDDIIPYNHLDSSTSAINLLNFPSLYYKEYTYFSYTNPNLLYNHLKEMVNSTTDIKLPYVFASNINQVSQRNISANNVTIPYKSSTALTYKKDSNNYVLSKMGSDKIDVSTAKEVTFNNVLILFCDSTTYETANNSELIMHTMGQGLGYYASGGMAEKISWYLDESGQMTLLNTDGESLVTERGNFYIAYVKSSRSNYNIFS